jgi:hypothetical protein
VVCRHLNQHRLLTTEVYVKGADFKAIRVEATVAANPYAAFDVIAQALQQHINDYLDPLRLPVPDDPWPVWDFGNELQPTSLYAVFMRVKDVTSVKALALYVDGVPHDLDKPVVVPPDGLVYGVDDHEIVVVPKEDL